MQIILMEETTYDQLVSTIRHQFDIVVFVLDMKDNVKSVVHICYDMCSHMHIAQILRYLPI